jgi:hypothetical protein
VGDDLHVYIEISYYIRKNKIMLSLITCSLLVVLSIVIIVFTILDKTEYNLPLSITKYFGITLDFVLSLLALIFINIPIITSCIVCISILFLVSACIVGLKGVFLTITKEKKYEIYKYICMGCGILQVIAIIVFCSQF